MFLLDKTCNPSSVKPMNEKVTITLDEYIELTSDCSFMGEHCNKPGVVSRVANDAGETGG